MERKLINIILLDPSPIGFRDGGSIGYDSILFFSDGEQANQIIIIDNALLSTPKGLVYFHDENNVKKALSKDMVDKFLEKIIDAQELTNYLYNKSIDLINGST